MAALRHRYGWMCIGLVILVGCTRTQYRFRADNETYGVLREQTQGTSWMPPANYTIQPDPRARFFDPTPPDDPWLPTPGPTLYAYQLPELPDRDPGRFFRSSAEEIALTAPADSASYDRLAAGRPAADNVRLVHYQDQQPPIDDSSPDDDMGSQARLGTGPVGAAVGSREVAPIAPQIWEQLPTSCLIRMFEFRSIRNEYERTNGRQPSQSLRDPSPRLALEDIIELALINSREYQTQKENLYNTALQLTLERYDYQLKFSNFGNGSDVNYNHSINGGETVNRLSVPTTVSSEKVLATGGDLLARFANQVVLTFNGPAGFTADVGSVLLLDVSQRILQRDIVFESLTQSERNVVYAARDFARFRKTFFRNLASTYYGLLLSYRGIEIDSQDYFSNLRAFSQAEAEFNVGRRSRIQVDQIEQDVLRSRSNLIRGCTDLERGLDNLKLQIGLPTELPLNLDLTELEQLTLRDEVTVMLELIRRSRRSLQDQRGQAEPDHTIVLNSSIDLTQKMIAHQQLIGRLEQREVDTLALGRQLALLRADEAELTVAAIRGELIKEQQTVPPVPPLRIYQRTEDLINSLLGQIDRQLELATIRSASAESIDSLRQRWEALRQRHEQLEAELSRLVEQRAYDQIPVLVQRASELLIDCDALEIDTALLAGRQRVPQQQRAQDTLLQADQLLEQSGQLLQDPERGLVPIVIDMDDAMLTALVQRFDLMNQYGELADTWRRIKLAGDDLRSVLNLNASQTVRTRSDVNRVFDFTFDESETQLSLTFDTPLNRKAQRNAYRRSLINYQAGLRSIIALQDQIKLQVRDDLRDLQLDREQYRIAVASAALANERVLSTSLQLELNFQNITARDFLEAQQAYTASISAVASEHIGYILDRIELFLDLEALQVDESGIWPELYDEQYQPTPQLSRPPSFGPVYGRLPRGILPSHQIQRMLQVPEQAPMIYQSNNSGQQQPPTAPPPERLPPPD